MNLTIIIILVVIGLPMWLLGAYTMFHWAKTPKLPNDSSNRINNITSWHIGLTRPDVLGSVYEEYFQNDVMENIKRTKQR